MRVVVLGAGASHHACYPLASELRQPLARTQDSCLRRTRVVLDGHTPHCLGDPKDAHKPECPQRPSSAQYRLVRGINIELGSSDTYTVHRSDLIRVGPAAIGLVVRLQQAPVAVQSLQSCKAET